eukprot:TRINITY_DN63377_c0_g1_i1.p1 TRINITY_DN63377_c0_g1~~TRINITY_DN63377_c0_g1_i1.p1  ORF type:complete len:299 (+),score=21.71 TRINITY_DN63377_c0_g1_i1:39-899(+)
MINFNDGFGGGNLVYRNGIWNSCRESGDHGAINTWDRQPYLSLIRDGLPSLFPAYSKVSRNLIISNYESFDGIDNDDGSSYYDIGHNVFYLGEGLKSDYHGHGKLYHDNLNLGVGVCCFQFGFISGRDAASNVPANEFYQAGYVDRCINNRCVQRPGGSWIHGAFAILWGCNASLPHCAPNGKAAMEVSGNKLYRETERTCEISTGCDIACGMGSDAGTLMSLIDFKTHCGYDAASIFPMPSTGDMLAWSRELLLLGVEASVDATFKTPSNMKQTLLQASAVETFV